MKHKLDGSVDQFKSRLLTRIITQTYGVDYQETFVLVKKLSTIHALLSIVANLD